MEPQTEGVDPSDHQRINRANWDSRVPHHVRGYDLDRYRDDSTAISEVVEFDLPRLGDVRGLRGVHLQCHLGSDTLSLARLGATMTGLDFSGAAVAAARALADELALSIDYVESDVHDAVEVLGTEQFDFVYTGVGALCWLPSVSRWAAVVAALLRPGGFLFIREGHPMMWALGDDDLSVEYPYFETEGVVFTGEYTYVEHDEPLASPTMVHFNHGLAEIFNALWNAGMAITVFEEHATVPWQPMSSGFVEVGGGEYTLADRPERLPLSYTLRAEKR